MGKWKKVAEIDTYSKRVDTSGKASFQAAFVYNPGENGLFRIIAVGKIWNGSIVLAQGKIGTGGYCMSAGRILPGNSKAPIGTRAIGVGPQRAWVGGLEARADTNR